MKIGFKILFLVFLSFVFQFSSYGSEVTTREIPGLESFVPVLSVEEAELRIDVENRSELLESTLGVGDWLAPFSPLSSPTPEESSSPEFMKKIPESLLKKDSPRDVAHFVWKSIELETDQRQFGEEEHWQTPLEVLQSGKGDCEDVSFLTQSLFTLSGETSFVLHVFGDHQGHSLAVFKSDEGYHVVDGGKLKNTVAKDLTQIARESNPFWKKAQILRYDLLKDEFITLASFNRR